MERKESRASLRRYKEVSGFKQKPSKVSTRKISTYFCCSLEKLATRTFQITYKSFYTVVFKNTKYH